MNIPIALLPHQMKVMRTTARKVLLLCGRGAGKTFICAVLALTTVMQGKTVMIGGQRYDTLHDTLYAEIKRLATEWGIYDMFTWHESPMMVDYNGAHIYFGTYQSPDAARGYSRVALLILDEMFLAPSDILAIWAPVMRNTGTTPRIVGASTPRPGTSWNVFFASPECDWEIIRAGTKDNTFISQVEFDTFASTIHSKDQWDSEIEGKIILDAGATSIIDLQCFPREPAYTSNSLVYGGLDMAHTGQRDSHVFAATQGNRLLAFHQFGICGSEEVCAYIRRFHKAHPLSSLNMDLAWSESVFDQLKYEIHCRQVGFGERAPDDQMRQYGNIRAFGYFNLAKRHKEGLCVDMSSEWIDPDLVAEYKREMCNTHFTLMRDGRLLIEAKDLIKERIGRSPDPADAMLLTQLDYRDIDAPTIIPANVGGMGKNEIARILDAYDD